MQSPNTDVITNVRNDGKTAFFSNLVEPQNGNRFSHHSYSSDHFLTFFLVSLFSFLLFYRPFELFPELSYLSSIVLPVAVLTVIVFIYSQFSSTRPFFDLTPETKCVFALTFIALVLLPISVNKTLAIDGLRDGLGKVSIIFLILSIAINTPRRVSFIQWLIIGSALILIIQLLNLYRQGVFLTESYRITTGYGMIGNPNEASIFLLAVLPFTLTLSFLQRSLITKIFLLALVFSGIVCVLLTQSRGGFLGLVVVVSILIWKLGKKARLKMLVFSFILFAGILAFAPSNYTTRIIAIFDPNKDKYGSSQERTELLKRSLIVTARNPWGIGLGNSSTFGVRNLETHNSYTQVSSELGILGLIAFVILLYYPIRELNKIENATKDDSSSRWYYFQSIGLQAGIGGFVVTCFFASVAFQWYIYYPIAMAIAVRKLYKLPDNNHLVKSSHV